jgi:hypothetical protein
MPNEDRGKNPQTTEPILARFLRLLEETQSRPEAIFMPALARGWRGYPCHRVDVTVPDKTVASVSPTDAAAYLPGSWRIRLGGPGRPGFVPRPGRFCPAPVRIWMQRRLQFSKCGARVWIEFLISFFVHRVGRIGLVPNNLDH